MSRTLLITGFHRSGTSMTAQLLMNAGLHLGDSLLAGNESNPYGHFEDTRVIGFHDRMLASRGLGWQVDRPFLPRVTAREWSWLNSYILQRNGASVWGFKDPRLCLFVPLWKRVLPEAKILFVYRPAEECLYSLKRRSARDLMNDRGGRPVHLAFWKDLDLAARVYLCYTRMFLRSVDMHRPDVAFVSRDAIIQGFDLPAVLNRLWGFELGSAPVEDVYDVTLGEVEGGTTFTLDAELRRRIGNLTSDIEQRLLENKH